MGYFDKSIDKHFNLNADGKQIVYPWNSDRGYVLPNAQQYLDMRSAIRRKLIFEWWQPYYYGLVIFCINSLFTPEPLNYFGTPLLVAGISAITEQLVNYDLRRIPRRCLVTLEKQIVVVSNKPSLLNLKKSLIFSFLFLIGGVVWMWQLPENQDLFRFIDILMIIFSGFFCIKNIRLIMARKANTSKKTI